MSEQETTSQQNDEADKTEEQPKTDNTDTTTSNNDSKDQQTETENKASDINKNESNDAENNTDNQDKQDTTNTDKTEPEIDKKTNDEENKQNEPQNDNKSENPSPQNVQATETKTEEKNTENNAESEVHAFNISSLMSIKFDTEKYLILKHKKDSFALYQLTLTVDTERKTSWNLYFKYSEIDTFHRKLSYFHNRLLKFQPNLKKTLFLPKMPPKKQWQRNKLHQNFIAQRIRLLNIYMNELCQYVTNSTIKIQDLYLNFFQIDNTYKYIVNNDIEMLSKLYKYNQNIFTKTDNNKSNIFHYTIAQQSIQCIKWLLETLKDKSIINKLLQQQDQYHWTPLLLCKHLQNQQISDLFQPFFDNNIEEKKDENAMIKMPAQYKNNICSNNYKRNLWIIVNPFSGTAQAQQIWEGLVQPFLDFNKHLFEYKTLITTKQFHAQNECENLSIDEKYDNILILGGDGTIAEVINGFYYNKNIKHNICITPMACGSGNALAKELGTDNVLNCLRKLVDGFETCIDAYITSQIDEKDTYAFVSTQWGAISSIDLESEGYRWMGALRFTVKAVSEVAYSPSYNSRVYFKPVSKNILKEFQDKSVKESDGRVANNAMDWWKELKKDNKVNGYPSDWICVEGDFGLLCVTNLQWIAEDTCMGGKDFNAKTNTLRLVYNERTGRMDYANVLLGLENGKHLDLECVKYYDVEEVVIEPLSDGPPMDVDGERKPLKVIYMKVLPSDFVVIC